LPLPLSSEAMEALPNEALANSPLDCEYE
jgi:hypothetical protein